MKILKKFLLLLTFLFLLCGCEYDDYDVPYNPHDGATYVPDEEAMYQAIYKKLTSGKFRGEICLYGYANVERAFEISEMVLLEHPELFWVNIGAVGTSGNNDVISINYGNRDFDMPDSKVKKICDEVSEAADLIINSVPEGVDDWEKILFVHDEIIKNTWYQSGDLESYTDTAYGCLVKRRTQSDGYAQAFQYIMERMGFECGMVTNKYHSWNFIRLDGKYYWVDLAYDDPNSDNSEYGSTHEFFLCADSELTENHDLSKGKNRFVPKCEDISKYYYVVDGSYFNSFDASAIAEIMKKHSDDAQVEVKFSDENVYNDALKCLEDNEVVTELIQAQNDKEILSYWMYPDYHIIKVILAPEG